MGWRYPKRSQKKNKKQFPWTFITSFEQIDEVLSFKHASFSSSKWGELYFLSKYSSIWTCLLWTIANECLRRGNVHFHCLACTDSNTAILFCWVLASDCFSSILQTLEPFVQKCGDGQALNMGYWYKIIERRGGKKSFSFLSMERVFIRSQRASLYIDWRHSAGTVEARLWLMKNKREKDLGHEQVWDFMVIVQWYQNSLLLLSLCDVYF